MRKVLVVLLALSVMSGAFADDIPADGNWWMWGSAQIVARLDFAGVNEGWLNTADGGVWFGAKYVGINLKEAGLGFSTGGAIDAFMEYGGDNYAFKGYRPLFNILTNGSLSGIAGAQDIYGGWIDAWGWYNMMGGMVHMHVALAGGPDKDWWTSNGAVGVLNLGSGWVNFDHGKGGFLTNFSFVGLDFGLTLIGDARWISNVSNRNIVEVFKEALVIGLAFNMDALGFAAQFKMADYNAYFGVDWQLSDAFKAGLSFSGKFPTVGRYAGVGVGVYWDATLFGAQLEVGYGLPFDSGATGWTLALAPQFWYKVLADHMQFNLDAKFTFNNFGGSATNTVAWEFHPRIFWNFKGAGATDDPGTGFIIGYFVGHNGSVISANNAYVVFKWDF